MKIRVIYHSRLGNTEKVAKAIAARLNVVAEKIDKKSKLSIVEPIDLLFIGDGIYWAKPHKSTRKFIGGLDPEYVKTAAAFGTYGNQFKIGDDIKSLLEKRGIKIVGIPFTCKGASIGTKNANHPDENDFNAACEFAESVVKMSADVISE
ncbi:MAG: nitric oxide synthase [Firmicutes bacterium]|nr:nitric oxide synthase [Bacillota bacterium]